MLRDINFYLTLLGLIIGCTGIYLAWRHRYPGKITYIREGLISLFNDVVRSMPELAVTYEGAPIQANFVILRGHLLNSGRKDFTPDMIDQPLSFDLPVGFKWRKVTITSRSNGLKAQSETPRDSSLVFNLGLFRCKEHISFEALVEVPDIPDSKETPAIRLNKVLKINHRIADTRPVDTSVLPADPNDEKLWKKSNISQFLILLLVFAVLLPGLNLFVDKPAEFEYSIRKNENVFQAKVQPKATGDVVIKSKDGNIKYTQGSEEFFRDKTWTAKAVPLKQNFWSYLSPALVLTIFGLFAIMDVVEYRRSVKLYRLLKEPELADQPKK